VRNSLKQEEKKTIPNLKGYKKFKTETTDIHTSKKPGWIRMLISLSNKISGLKQEIHVLCEIQCCIAGCQTRMEKTDVTG